MSDPRDIETLAREEPQALEAVAERAGPELEDMLRDILEEAGSGAE